MASLSECLNSADDNPKWIERYLDLVVRGIRSAKVTGKIDRRLERLLK
ncbi:hypothetical protein [Nonomuraea guangzhouensis]|uniref:Uncharacterized protein n=1 Tax=Nonomuraea guangzhouensis TaxID=1291555 RepID=A0ABW4GGM7_9ACTN|nr:hypothetical protein [Nonomuraea guangzhouensis]